MCCLTERTFTNWAGDKVKLENTHGTGCTFASAIAAQLAAGRSLIEATTLAKAYVMKGIEKAYPIGKGRLPLDHFYRMRIEPLTRGTHEVPQHGLHPAQSRPRINRDFYW